MQEWTEIEQEAHQMLDDLEPDDLSELSKSIFDSSNRFPGELGMQVAEKTGAEEYTRQCAGAQMVYAGLNKTRDITDNPEWAGVEAQEKHDEASIELLAAEVLVGQAMVLLSGTAAMEPAVKAVQSFASETTRGDQTNEFTRAIITLAVTAGSAPTHEVAPTVADVASSVNELESCAATQINLDRVVEVVD